MSTTFTAPDIQRLPKAKRAIVLADLQAINDYLDAPSAEKWAALPQSARVDLIDMGVTHG